MTLSSFCVLGGVLAGGCSKTAIPRLLHDPADFAAIGAKEGTAPVRRHSRASITSACPDCSRRLPHQDRFATSRQYVRGVHHNADWGTFRTRACLVDPAAASSLSSDDCASSVPVWRQPVSQLRARHRVCIGACGTTEPALRQHHRVRRPIGDDPRMHEDNTVPYANCAISLTTVARITSVSHRPLRHHGTVEIFPVHLSRELFCTVWRLIAGSSQARSHASLPITIRDPIRHSVPSTSIGTPTASACSRSHVEQKTVASPCTARGCRGHRQSVASGAAAEGSR